MNTTPANLYNRALFMAVAVLLSWSASTLAVQQSSIIDEVLKERLIVAMADSGFIDRFDAEVWLVDMAERLKSKMPEEEKRLPLLRLIHQEAQRANLEPEVVLAVIEVESNFDRFAISRAGAQGLMQIMPFWLDELDRPDDNLFHVETNLRMGCTILRYYLDMEKGDLTRALARYNGSLGSQRYPLKVYSALRNRWAQR